MKATKRRDCGSVAVTYLFTAFSAGLLFLSWMNTGDFTYAFESSLFLGVAVASGIYYVRYHGRPERTE